MKAQLPQVDPDNQKGFIEEYKELRAEIRHYLDRRAKSIHFAFILTAAVVGVGPELESPFLFILSSLLIAFLWYDEMRRYQAVCRVGAYLELFVEPHVNGLNWETFGKHHPIQTSIFDRLISNGIYPVIFWVHAGFAWRYAKWSIDWKMGIMLVLLTIFIILLIRSYIVTKRARENEVNAWTRIVDQMDL